MSTNPRNITPIGLVVAVLIVCILAALAVPRLRAVSYEEDMYESPKILAKFGAEVSAVAEIGGVGVIITCKACDGTPMR